MAMGCWCGSGGKSKVDERGVVEQSERGKK
jgi:hypothetical protein